MTAMQWFLMALGVWIGLALIVAWGWMRWYQWLRGDFDKPHG